MRPSPPFRADHVGSLLRPPELKKAREDHAAGRIDAAELRAVEDSAIADAVRMQEEIGLQAVTDGEFRRSSWHMDFIYQLGGFHESDVRMTSRFRNADGVIEYRPSHARVDEKVRLEHTIFGDDFAALKDMATRRRRS